VQLGGSHRWRLEDVRTFLAQLTEAERVTPPGLEAKKAGEGSQVTGSQSTVTTTPVSTRVDKAQSPTADDSASQSTTVGR
jgi:hypothetical protein